MSWPGFWQRRSAVSTLLAPVALLYRQLSLLDQQRQLRQRESLPVPVIVVGNLVVGGTGKTPFICWLVDHLKSWGYRPGIISRGYGGGSSRSTLVDSGSDASVVGDEPLLLARQTGVPLCVGRNRLAAAKHLLQAHPKLDVLISDDGLQHWRLPRQVQICLFDGQIGAGNERLLPAGPLREPLSQLADMDLVISKGGPLTFAGNASQATVALEMTLTLDAPKPISGIGELPDRSQAIAAVCGIGQPQSFFDLLTHAGWLVEPHALPDHGPLPGRLKSQLKGRTVFMTSKDAVKLAGQTLPFDAWEVPLTVQFSQDAAQRIRQQVEPGLKSFYGRVHTDRFSG